MRVQPAPEIEVSWPSEASLRPSSRQSSTARSARYSRSGNAVSSKHNHQPNGPWAYRLAAKERRASDHVAGQRQQAGVVRAEESQIDVVVDLLPVQRGRTGRVGRAIVAINLERATTGVAQAEGDRTVRRHLRLRVRPRRYGRRWFGRRRLGRVLGRPTAGARRRPAARGLRNRPRASRDRTPWAVRSTVGKPEPPEGPPAGSRARPPR